MPKCETCDDGGWVCENHRDKAWQGGDAKCCAENPPNDDPRWAEWGCGAGAPCPDCKEGLALGGFDAISASVDPIPPGKAIH